MVYNFCCLYIGSFCGSLKSAKKSGNFKFNILKVGRRETFRVYVGFFFKKSDIISRLLRILFVFESESTFVLIVSELESSGQEAGEVS